MSDAIENIDVAETTEDIEAREKRELDQKEKLKRRAMFENNIIAKQMHTYDGRAFVWRMLSMTNAYHENLCGDALQMAKFEGERAIGLRLTHLVLTITPDQYNLMRSEALQREKGWK